MRDFMSDNVGKSLRNMQYGIYQTTTHHVLRRQSLLSEMKAIPTTIHSEDDEMMFSQVY